MTPRETNPNRLSTGSRRAGHLRGYRSSAGEIQAIKMLCRTLQASSAPDLGPAPTYNLRFENFLADVSPRKGNDQLLGDPEYTQGAVMMVFDCRETAH